MTRDGAWVVEDLMAVEMEAHLLEMVMAAVAMAETEAAIDFMTARPSKKLDVKVMVLVRVGSSGTQHIQEPGHLPEAH